MFSSIYLEVLKIDKFVNLNKILYSCDWKTHLYYMPYFKRMSQSIGPKSGS